MSKKILWLDNDAGYIAPFVEGLRENGYDVTTVTNVTDAERFVNASIHDLVIVDVMIPTRGDEEERTYTPTDTDQGYQTGLFFYRRLKTKLEKTATQVLALTVRQDQAIVDAFEIAGLGRNHIATKFDLRDFQGFLLKIHTLLGDN